MLICTTLLLIGHTGDLLVDIYTAKHGAYCRFQSGNDPRIMPWIISNGKNYVEITPLNQMIATSYIDQAHAFTNKKTAEKYCSLLPKSMKNLKYC